MTVIFIFDINLFGYNRVCLKEQFELPDCPFKHLGRNLRLQGRPFKHPPAEILSDLVLSGCPFKRTTPGAHPIYGIN